MGSSRRRVLPEMLYVVLIVIGCIQTALILPPIRKVLRRLDDLEAVVHGRNRQEGPPAAKAQVARKQAEATKIPHHPLYL